MQSATFLIFSIVFGEVCNALAARKLTEYPQPRDNLGGQTLFDIWDYKGESPQIFRLWKTVQVMLNLSDASGTVKMYQDATVSEIEKAHQADNRIVNSLFRMLTPAWNPSAYIHPFTSVYVGVETDSSYEIFLKTRNVDYRLALMFVVGIMLYLGAKRLSRSATAFYAGGTMVGVIGSLIIIVLIFYRLAPKRSMAFTILLGGWSVVAYIIYVVWSNIYTIIADYYRYVAVYLVSVASISFAIAYWWGPPKGVRTLNLVQWALELLGLVLVYFGCQIPSVAIATIVIMVLMKNMPEMLGRRFLWIRYRLFPPKRRLLTEAEYLDEGARETRKALEELRRYCQSPNCDSWKTVSRLKSPSQFAEFVSGRRSHISDDEALRYDESFMDDREDEGDDDEESESGSSTYDLRSTPTRGNVSFGNFEMGQRNGARQRFFESFNPEQSAIPSSAPSKLTRSGRFGPR